MTVYVCVCDCVTMFVCVCVCMSVCVYAFVYGGMCSALVPGRADVRLGQRWRGACGRGEGMMEVLDEVCEQVP